MSKKQSGNIPSNCPRTCEVFDNDLDALLSELSQITDTDMLLMSLPSGSELDSLLEALTIDTDATLEALDTSGHCPFCRSKPNKT